VIPIALVESVSGRAEPSAQPIDRILVRFAGRSAEDAFVDEEPGDRARRGKRKAEWRAPDVAP